MVLRWLTSGLCTFLGSTHRNDIGNCSKSIWSLLTAGGKCAAFACCRSPG